MVLYATYVENKSVYLFRCSYKGLSIRADILHESAFAMRSASANVQSVVGSPLSMSRSVRDALSRNVNERQNVCRLAGPVGPFNRLHRWHYDESSGRVRTRSPLGLSLAKLRRARQSRKENWDLFHKICILRALGEK